MESAAVASDTDALHCIQCEQAMDSNEDMEKTEKGPLCRSCYSQLADEVRSLVRQQGENIDYTRALFGAFGGGIVGAAAWWGFTVLTNIEFGLVAIVIGFTVAKGMLMATGGKRSLSLQFISVAVSCFSYFYATYLVNRTFILQEYPGQAYRFGLLPNPGMFLEINRLAFDLFTVVFLGIVIYQAWKMLAPIRLETE